MVTEKNPIPLHTNFNKYRELTHENACCNGCNGFPGYTLPYGDMAMIMPFGKYEGIYTNEIPRSYLRWLWGNVQLREPLKSEVRRLLYGDEDEDRYARATYMPTEPSKVQHVYRTLAFKWHPDRGGTKEAMQAVNEFRDLLAASTW